MITVASWNVNSIKARLPHLERWCAQVAPDVLALQETKTVDGGFPLETCRNLGYHAAIAGQPAYNGVAILSRQPPLDVVRGIPGFADEQQRVLGVHLPELFVLNLYVPNGAAVDSDKYVYKLAWLDALLGWLPTLLAEHPRLVVVGDFNIAPADRDVHDRRNGKIRSSAANQNASGCGSCWPWGWSIPFGSLSPPGGLLFVVGLPRGGLSPQSWLAHRPGPCQPGARRDLPRRPHRPRTAGLGEAV